MAVRETHELKADIISLKDKTSTLVFAHRYQEPDIIGIADCVGDTVELASVAMHSDCKRIVVCGVYFTAEAIKLLSPEKEVVLAHSQARCPMAGKVFPGRVREFRENNPQVCCVCDISMSIAIKAECDICVTADSALKVLGALKNRDILFLGDKNLAEHIAQALPDINIRSWPCSCPVLSSVEVRDIELARQRWPESIVLVNSSCPHEVAAIADMVGSTGDIVSRCELADEEQEISVADEVSVCRMLKQRWPQKCIHQIAASKLACNMMKITTLEVVEKAISGSSGLVIRPDSRFAAPAADAISRLINIDTN